MTSSDAFFPLEGAASCSSSLCNKGLLPRVALACGKWNNRYVSDIIRSRTLDFIKRHLWPSVSYRYCQIICDLLSNSSRPPTASRELTALEKRDAGEESALPSVCKWPKHCDAQLLEMPAHRMAFGNCLWSCTIFVPSSLWHKISTNFLRQCSKSSAYQLRHKKSWSSTAGWPVPAFSPRRLQGG